MTFYINNKKVSKAMAQKVAGAERFKEILVEAKEAHAEDPYEQISFMVSGGMLAIEF